MRDGMTAFERRLGRRHSALGEASGQRPTPIERNEVRIPGEVSTGFTMSERPLCRRNPVLGEVSEGGVEAPTA